MPEDKTPIGYAEDTQIQAWKNKYKLKYVHEITTEDEVGDFHVTYVRKPDLDHLQLVATHAKKDKEITGLTLMFKAIRLGGSDEVMNDSEMLLAAVGEAGQLFKKREAKVKKR